MSIGGRLHYLAIGGLLVALLPCTALGQAGKEPEAPSANPETQQQPIAVPDSATLRAIFDEAMKIYAREKAAADDADKRKEARDDAALIAQQDAARWGFWSAAVAIAALFANTAAIILVWLTFRETRRTADAAVAAAVAAEDAIFEDGAPFLYPEIAYDSIGRVLTPLIHNQFRQKDEPPKVAFRIKNFGQSPAVLRNWSAEARVFEMIPDEMETVVAFPSPQAIIEPGVSIGMGVSTVSDEFSVKVNPSVTPEIARRISNGEAHIVLFGDCRFSGTHGANYTQTFGLRYSWKTHQWLPLGAQQNRRTRDRPENSKIPRQAR